MASLVNMLVGCRRLQSDGTATIPKSPSLKSFVSCNIKEKAGLSGLRHRMVDCLNWKCIGTSLLAPSEAYIKSSCACMECGAKVLVLAAGFGFFALSLCTSSLVCACDWVPLNAGAILAVRLDLLHP